LAAIGAGTVARAAPPTDPSGFTAFVAQSFRQARPADRVRIAGELALDIQAPAGEFTTDLHTVYGGCGRFPEHCDDIVAMFVNKISAVHVDAPVAPKASQLRVVVRPEAYVDEMRRNAPPGAEPVAAPLAGGLWMIGAADMPTAIVMLNTAGLGSLKLSQAEILERGRRNMRADMIKALQGLEPPIAEHGVVAMIGDDYESSLLAFPDLWAALAAKAGGDLYVAAPAREIVIVCRADHRQALSALKQAAAAAAVQSAKPLPLVVLRSTQKGWEAGDASGAR